MSKIKQSKIKQPKMNIKSEYMKSFSSTPIKGLSSKEDMPSKRVKKFSKKKSIFSK